MCSLSLVVSSAVGLSTISSLLFFCFFFFQAEDGIRDAGDPVGLAERRRRAATGDTVGCQRHHGAVAGCACSGPIGPPDLVPRRRAPLRFRYQQFSEG